MRTWILSWLFLALTVIGFTLFSAFSAKEVSAQSASPMPSAQPVSTASAQVVPAPLFLAGSDIELNQESSGPAFVAASRVRQTETVFGDLVVASGNTVLTGTLEQDVYVATGTLVIEGTVRGNVIVAAGEVIISPGARIDGSLIAVTQRLNMAGEIGSSLQATAEHVILQGLVGGTSTVYAQKLSLNDATQINILSGEVQELEETPGASVSSRQDFNVQPKEERPAQPAQNMIMYLLWGAVQGAFLGIMLWWLTRAVWPGALVQLQTQLATVLAWGFTLGLVWPAIGLLLLATIVGFPLMILGTTIWLGFLWLGWIIPALALATHSQFLTALPKLPLWARVLLVTAAWGALMTLPWVGWILRITSGLVGLGLVALAIQSRWAKPRRSASKK